MTSLFIDSSYNNLYQKTPLYSYKEEFFDMDENRF